MAAESKTSVPPDKLALYHAVLKAAGVEAKANFGAAYTAVNGNMYSMVSKHGVMGLRLPKAELEAFFAKFKTTLYRADPKWPPNKEMAAIPDALLKDTKKLAPFVKASHAYALSLRPKPTKKKD
ncbi:MAG TPA: hypothetical protein VGL66_12445 [Caulobacteraceae bacterium]|jgi:hypothetical protein